MASSQPQARDVNFQEVWPQPPAASAPPPDAAQAFMPAQPRVLVGEPNQPLMVQQPVDNATCEKIGFVCGFFVPFVGWITFCIGCSAPAGSARKKWSQYACGSGLLGFALGVSVRLATSHS
mmetsp:Transcript_130559/g.260514  ORF Transcript_130559/g.260514 Transcript_130559/m.260514 type:complete len:121 (+) Transcript_130559:89-451(+)